MKYKVISKKKLRVRAKASVTGKVLRYLASNSIVEIDKVVGKWGHLSSGGYSSIKYLKKVEEPKPTPKPSKTNAQKITELATLYAYKTNDSKAKYPKGKPVVAFKNGLEKAYPSSVRSKWKYKAWRDGASCGVFVGTCVRNAGVDKNFPHYTAKQFGAFEDRTKWIRIEPKKDKIKDGDIFIYKHGKSGHIGIFVGGKVKEASYNDFYPKTTNTVKARLSKDNPKNKTNLKVYRAL